MFPLISWLEHDHHTRERTTRLLQLFRPEESRDELGLGIVRDAFSDIFFPGTSTIQTRLRYMLFIPWTYVHLEKELKDRKIHPKDFGKKAEKFERDLIAPLRLSGNQGVIGGRSGRRVERTASIIYWAGLESWGIRRYPISRDLYHYRMETSPIGCIDRRLVGADSEDEFDSYWSELPAAPQGFPDRLEVLDFNLSNQEAQFILARFEISHPNSLLTYLAKGKRGMIKTPPWDQKAGKFPSHFQPLLYHARMFSDVMHGASLMYHILLWQRKKPDAKLLSQRLGDFEKWGHSLNLTEINEWKPEEMWWLLFPVNALTKNTETFNFVREWLRLIKAGIPNLLLNTEARSLIESREKNLKGNKSRFRSDEALRQWAGIGKPQKLLYRWSNVNRLLVDLFDGLER